jgi:serine/threonine protein kinase
MGTVFLAEDRLNNNVTRVVKQLIHKSSAEDAEARESIRLFMREAEILRKLDHDGIVKVHDHYASEDGRYFLVMDYVPGRNLEMIVNTNGPLNNDLAVRIGIQCAEVLEYLHAQHEPIIYRDLKPSNLMLTPDGLVVFIDFGIARQFMPKEAATRVVTAGYSPPEQYFGRQDTRSDIYSLGATLSQLLTAVRPKPLTPSCPSAQNSAVLASLNQLIMSMTSQELDDRPANARAVRYALYHIYKEIHPDWQLPEMPDASGSSSSDKHQQVQRSGSAVDTNEMPVYTPLTNARYRSLSDVRRLRTTDRIPVNDTPDDNGGWMQKVKSWFESVLRR